jgi:hypothetical protein
VAISLDIGVTDIAATLAFGYTHIRVYRSADEDSGFTEITTTSTLVELVAGTSTYNFIDSGGTGEHWYRTTFVDVNGVVAESSASASFLGDYLDTNFSPINYPAEATFTSREMYVVARLRNLVGDPRELSRDYISADTTYSNVSTDKKSVALSNPRGWPLRVVLDGTDYTSSEEPRVNDYQFVTFSGIEISTVSGTLDIWYYHFRNSDSELLNVFNGLTVPPELTADQVTFELSLVTAAVEVLEKEFRLFTATSSTQVDIYQEISINPRAGVDARLEDLEALRKRKKDLIDEILSEAASDDIYGVLIE